LKAFFSSNGWKIFQSFEKQFSCAGVCKVPLFYMTKDLSAGVPAQSCDTAMINKVAGNVGAGAVAVVTGLIMLSMFGASFPLCTGKSDPNSAMG
jgi:hypothetical protein